MESLGHPPLSFMAGVKFLDKNLKTDTTINRIKTVDAYKTVDTTCKTNTSIIEKTVGDCKIPKIFNRKFP